MTLPIYSALINKDYPCFSDSDQAAEKKNNYHVLTERHLQAMWLEQKYFKTLKTQNNDPIEILSSGIWNSEAGPDFLKAHIKIGNQEWRGDIEIHLSPEGWVQHNHHTDPNYDQVILHICYWQPKKPYVAYTSNGKEIACAYLQPSLTISESRILKLIDLDLYPYKHFAGSGKCSRTLFNRLSKEKTTALLRSAAAWRLNEKNDRLKAKIDPSHNIVLGGIAMVLGYKHNAEAFLAIFHAINVQKIRGEQEILTYALGISNFFHPHFQKKWSDSPFYQNLQKAFEPNLIAFPSVPLKLHKIRPANHPVRRLAVLAKILNDPEIATLETKALTFWRSYWKSCQKEGWKELKEAFLALIPSYKDDYWEYHYTFEKAPQKKSIALLGEDLKWEILINVCLPILYTTIEHQGEDLEKLAFFNFYHSIPAAKTKKSVYLNHRFFGDTQKNTKFTRADLQQGAYQIHRDFCIHFEASCQGCPFVDRYKNAFG